MTRTAATTSTTCCGRSTTSEPPPSAASRFPSCHAPAVKRALTSSVPVVLALCALAGGARADGRAELQTDALLAGRPYEGLLVLQGGYGNSSWVDADALVFMGATEDGREGDVLIVSVRLREPHGLGEARVGRFILSTGAVRPVQIDGVRTLARAPTGSTLELFGGLPVVPELGPRSFDWLAG